MMTRRFKNRKKMQKYDRNTRRLGRSGLVIGMGSLAAGGMAVGLLSLDMFKSEPEPVRVTAPPKPKKPEINWEEKARHAIDRAKTAKKRATERGADTAHQLWEKASSFLEQAEDSYSKKGYQTAIELADSATDNFNKVPNRKKKARRVATVKPKPPKPAAPAHNQLTPKEFKDKNPMYILQLQECVRKAVNRRDVRPVLEETVADDEKVEVILFFNRQGKPKASRAWIRGPGGPDKGKLPAGTAKTIVNAVNQEIKKLHADAGTMGFILKTKNVTLTMVFDQPVRVKLPK